MSKLTKNVSHYVHNFFSKFAGQKRFSFDLNHKFAAQPQVVNDGPKFQPQIFLAFINLELRLIRRKKADMKRGNNKDFSDIIVFKIL